MNDRIYSVTEVIEALPELNGQTVTIRGRITIGREDHSIADPGFKDWRLRLWVNFHHATLGTRGSRLAQFNGLDVTATGTLDQSRKGHFSSCAGSFTIRRLTPNEASAA